jgi:hypothetical protein
MRLTVNVFKAALAVACLVIAACSGNGSDSSQSSQNGNAIAASVRDASIPGTASPSGTTIPSATQITDAGGNVWTVSDGVIYENGTLAGYSANVTLLLYDNNSIYQENSAGGWWSWTDSAWVSSSDPRASSSPNGTTIPSATQITDAGSNVWTVSGGVIYENGTLAGYSANVTLLLYYNDVIYQENAAGGWWSWVGGAWVSSSDPRTSSSPSGTTIPSATQIIDSSGTIWTVSGGVISENGAPAGYSANVTLLVYENNTIYQENAAGGWWSWTNGTWASSGDPRGASDGGSTSLTISGSPSTSDVAGQSYRFVPSTSNPGGGTLGFSIANMPAWATFDAGTGTLSGTPSSAQVGDYPNIQISVSDGSTSVSLAAFSINVVAGSATLSWTAPTQNTDGTPITNLAGYTIYYGTSPGDLTQNIQVADPTATTYVVNNLTAGTYYFAVAAYTTVATQSADSSVASKTIQ